MTKDFVPKQGGLKKKDSIRKQFLLIIISFVFGVSTTFFDFSTLKKDMIVWLGKTNPTSISPKVTNITQQKTKFEFYTLLAERGEKEGQDIKAAYNKSKNDIPQELNPKTY